MLIGEEGEIFSKLTRRGLFKLRKSPIEMGETFKTTKIGNVRNRVLGFHNFWKRKEKFRLSNFRVGIAG